MLLLVVVPPPMSLGLTVTAVFCATCTPSSYRVPVVPVWV